MDTTARLSRAILLAQQHRLADAERELRAALLADPHDAFALALLANVVAQTADDGGAEDRVAERLDEAERLAEAGIAADPSLDFAHHARAQVLLSRGRLDDAHNAAVEAVKLDPADASHRRLLAQIAVRSERWNDALARADEALSIDPEDADASSLRAIALTHLGRHDEAREASSKALADEPDSTFTHTARGWTALHAGEVDPAITHFREALRLQPDNEAAKLGLAEALKGRSRWVRWILASRLCAARLGSRGQFWLILGLWIGQRVLRDLARRNPSLEPWVTPILAVYLAFVVLSWTWTPLTDVLLRLTPYGRNLLTRDRIAASNWVAGLLGAGLLALGAALLLAGRNQEMALMGGVGCLLLIPATSSVFRCRRGWPRIVMALLAALVAAAGIVALLLFAFAKGRAQQGLFDLMAMVFVFGAIGAMWLGAFLPMVPERR